MTGNKGSDLWEGPDELGEGAAVKGQGPRLEHDGVEYRCLECVCANCSH